MLNDPTLQYAREDDQDPEMPTLPQSGGAGIPPMGEAPKVAPGAPQVAAAAPKPSIPMITAGDLEQAQDEKLKLTALGAMGNALANRQTAGNFYLGRMQPKVDVSGTASQLSGIVDQGIKNKQILQQQSLQAPELQYMRNAIDPTSDQSKTSVQLHQALLKKYGAQLSSTNPEMSGIFNQAADSLNGKSAYDVGKMMDGPLGKIMSQEDIATTKNQLMAALAGARLSQGQQRLDLARDNQVAGAANTFDKDHILSTLTQQQQQIRRDKHTLQTAETLTPQIFNEINLGIANAIANGKAAAVTTQGKTEWGSIENDWTSIRQRISNRPQDIGSPEVKQYTMDILNRLDQGYQKNMAERSAQVFVGRSYSHNPAAQKAVQDKVQSYQPQGADGDKPAGGPHGNTVYQNGQMYTWNPATQRYE